jgi:hypothetical protein
MNMRTTVDIDSPLLERLREEARRSGVSFKELLNHAIRLGLERRREGGAGPYVCPTFSLGAPRSPLDKALALAGELEDREVARKLSLRK